MAALEPVDIANMALALLTESPIDSLDDDDRNARLLALHYDMTREAELMKHAWRFAIFSADVEAYDTGLDGFRYSYELPADCLRVLPVTENGIEVDWRQEGSLVYTRRSGTRRILYIANLIDPNDWDALFTDVLAAALAVKMAHAVTHKTGMIEIAQRAYDRALSAALRANAMTRGHMPANTWAIGRGDYTSDRSWR